MARPIHIIIKESIKELKSIQKLKPFYYNRVQMLILIKEGVIVTKDDLAQALSASNKSVQTWRTKYIEGGIERLLEDNRGGKKVGQITPQIHQQLRARLNESKEGFKSFVEVQQWLKENFGIEMQYHAVNKYLKRKFGARPKVARKSHMDKDDNAVALFKKTTPGTKTY